MQISGAGKKRGGRKCQERGQEVTVSHLASGRHAEVERRGARV